MVLAEVKAVTKLGLAEVEVTEVVLAEVKAVTKLKGLAEVEVTEVIEPR